MKPEEIKILREGLGWSQSQLAVEVGVSLNTVNRWEKGRCKPSPLALSRLRILAGAVASGARPSINKPVIAGAGAEATGSQADSIKEPDSD